MTPDNIIELIGQLYKLPYDKRRLLAKELEIEQRKLSTACVILPFPNAAMSGFRVTQQMMEGE